MIVDLDPASTDAMESLSETLSTETEIPHQENQCLLKLISPPQITSLFHTYKYLLLSSYFQCDTKSDMDQGYRHSYFDRHNRCSSTLCRECMA